ncbi:hypothetical protein F4804DRAFT_148072 [Jackrogersella minutella]|nr:hypothetical protein F4804DRAFT_148072 [Jackrogersella minutella]
MVRRAVQLAIHNYPGLKIRTRYPGSKRGVHPSGVRFIEMVIAKLHLAITNLTSWKTLLDFATKACHNHQAPVKISACAATPSYPRTFYTPSVLICTYIHIKGRINRHSIKGESRIRHYFQSILKTHIAPQLLPAHVPSVSEYVHCTSRRTGRTRDVVLTESGWANCREIVDRGMGSRGSLNGIIEKHCIFRRLGVGFNNFYSVILLITYTCWWLWFISRITKMS